MTDGEVDLATRPSLRDDSRERARARILAGASIAVARFGLIATTDEIAAEAGVSRRTVFRHFATHGEVIAAVIRETISAIEELLPEAPAPDEDVDAWLVAALASVHQFIRARVGEAFWDLQSARLDLPAEAQVELVHVAGRRQDFAHLVASNAWTALGGVAEPPPWILDTFQLHMSGFATFGFPTYSGQETGELSAKVLSAVLAAALQADRATSPR